MSNRNALNFYIERIRQRLVLAAWMRGAATFTGTALIVTLALVLLLNHFAFPSRGLMPTLVRKCITRGEP